MYWFIDGTCFIIGCIQIIWPLKNRFYGFLWILIYPIILQAIYNIVVCLFASKVQYNIIPQYHIVYNDKYNISLCGIQKYHPFDSQKYGKAFYHLIQKNVIKIQEFHKPNKIKRGFLLERMSKLYLIKLNYSIILSDFIQLSLKFIPAFIGRKALLDPMLYATEGTILSIIIAKHLRWSINMSGGYHHASFDRGGGFCIYPDISLAVHYLRSRMGVRKVMIIDCDAHQGNGFQKDLLNDQQVYIIDFYNHSIYPRDHKVKKAIKKDLFIKQQTSDNIYLMLIDALSFDIEQFQPQFIIYNAGTDILQGDKLGKLSITAQGIIKRDQKVFNLALRNNIPISMLLSGGYQKQNAQIIAKSIENLYKKFQ